MMSRNAALPPHLERVMRGLLGQPCWQVRAQGTSLMLDFGVPRLEFYEGAQLRDRSRRGQPHPPRGASRDVFLLSAWFWRTLHCEWRIRIGRERRDRWHAPHYRRAPQRRAQRAAAEAGECLKGRALVRIELDARHRRCRLTFEGSAVLETRPWDRRGVRDDWLVRDPVDHWYAYRCRGEFCREPEVDGEWRWHPLSQARRPLVFVHTGPIRYPRGAIVARVGHKVVERGRTPRSHGQ